MTEEDMAVNFGRYLYQQRPSLVAEEVEERCEREAESLRVKDLAAFVNEAMSVYYSHRVTHGQA
ncbi:MAG: hypothetical protein ACRETA_04415 [Gammaproteobacteria bacterium]